MGLAEAQELTDFMVAALAEYSGIYYRGSTREDSSLKNADVMTYLAENYPSRNLRPLSDAMAQMLGEGWKQEIDNAAQSMCKKGGGLKKAYNKKAAYERAKIAAARAWKACGKAYLEELSRRIMGQITADDDGSESAADPVSDAYAATRESKYGIPRDRVYVATGQLLADLSPSVPGPMVLTKGEAAEGRAETRRNIRALAKSFVKETQSQLGFGKGKLIK
jgi:hypothetical protein